MYENDISSIHWHDAYKKKDKLVNHIWIFNLEKKNSNKSAECELYFVRRIGDKKNYFDDDEKLHDCKSEVIVNLHHKKYT